MILASGTGQLAVGDLGTDDLPDLAWSGNPAHLRSVAAAQQRAAQGLEDYLVVRAPGGQPVAKMRVDYPSEADTGIFSQLATMGPLQGLGVATMLIGAGEQRIRAVGPNFATRHNPRTAMTSPPDLHQRLARTVIAAMKTAVAPARLIAVSTASMGPADAVMGPGPRLAFRFLRTVVAPNLGRVGKDLQAMEIELAASGLDWYALRPVKLTDGPLTGHTHASDRFTTKTISRADVAWHILALAEDPTPRQQRTPVIATGAPGKSHPAGTSNPSAQQPSTLR